MAGFILTLVLLGLSYLLKIYINKTPKKMDYVKALSEVPIDIMFTSTAFIIAYQVANFGKLIREEAKVKDYDMNINLIYFVIYIVITIVVIVLWRHCETQLNESDGLEKGLKYIGIAFFISFGALVFALIKLNGVVR